MHGSNLCSGTLSQEKQTYHLPDSLRIDTVLMLPSMGLDSRSLNLPTLRIVRYLPSSFQPVCLRVNESYLSLLLNRGNPALPPLFLTLRKNAL